MSDKTIIIVGAGIAGLSAGCYAQMNGYRSRIYEMPFLPPLLRWAMVPAGQFAKRFESPLLRRAFGCTTTRSTRRTW